MSVKRRAAALLLAVLTALLVGAGLAGPASAAPYTHGPTISLSHGRVLEHTHVEIFGRTYVPHERVFLYLHSQTYTLGSAIADSKGSINFNALMPAGVLGTHTITGTGVTGDTASTTIVIYANAGSGGATGNGNGNGGLASTGVAIASIGGLALILIVAGWFFVLSGRRAKQNA